MGQVLFACRAGRFYVEGEAEQDTTANCQRRFFFIRITKLIYSILYTYEVDGSYLLKLVRVKNGLLLNMSRINNKVAGRYSGTQNLKLANLTLIL